MIKALTFDLWDTLIHDNSDEPKRAALGLPSKHVARRHVVWEALNGIAPLDAGILGIAYDVSEAAFNRVWHEQHVTWSVPERLTVLLSGLGRELPAADFDAVVRQLEEMEIEVMPDPIDGVGDALTALAGRYALGVVSDAIYSPGRCLREWLERHALKQHFSGFAFSDEVGRCKPHRAVFESIAAQLGVHIEEMIHVGDRDHNDVRGPQALGMKAILFTATRDHDKHTTGADAVCERAADLPGIVERLAANS